MPSAKHERVTFDGHSGAKLAARFDRPAGEIRAIALFAHCFTCTKDILAAKRIAQGLAQEGIAVLRFDFTGLGSSEGEFGSTNFSSNVEDLERAADWLRSHHAAPSLLIGHSLGGAAVLMAAGNIPEVRAVVTIGAPSDVSHVLHHFGTDLERIEREGRAKVSLVGRQFEIEQQFIEDIRETKLKGRISTMRKALLVMHSPTDQTVGIEHAGIIFQAAKHPKNFVALDGADHLLSGAADAGFAASIIANWSSRYVAIEAEAKAKTVENAEDYQVHVAETGAGKFQNQVLAGRYRILADEPMSAGGDATGPTPYDFLAIGLGACTNMTLRVYAGFKGIDVGRLSVEVRHGNIHSRDCLDCGEELTSQGGKIDRFERIISVDGPIDPELEQKLLEIADKCPVHKTLTHSAAVVTRISKTEN